MLRHIQGRCLLSSNDLLGALAFFDLKEELIVSEARRILYRGVPMIEGWPEKIEAAQYLRSYALSGRAVARIPYGSEPDDWRDAKHPCPHCYVAKGELHVPGCDGEECPVCGSHLLLCDCEFDMLKPDDCGS